MKRFTLAAIAALVLAATFGTTTPALAGRLCGFRTHWVPGHYVIGPRGARHWVRGHCAPN
jgi:hypothetical protein